METNSFSSNVDAGFCKHGTPEMYITGFFKLLLVACIPPNLKGLLTDDILYKVAEQVCIMEYCFQSAR